MMSNALVVLVTAPNTEEASRIADALVGARLAACVNILGGIESVYRWEGRIARDSEVLTPESRAGRDFQTALRKTDIESNFLRQDLKV